MISLQDIRKNKYSILEIAKKNGAKNVRIFGSVSRNEAESNSDIDFLVEFEDGRSLFDLINVKLELEDLLQRKVDIITEKSLHKIIAAKVMKEAVQL